MYLENLTNKERIQILKSSLASIFTKTRLSKCDLKISEDFSFIVKDKKAGKNLAEGKMQDFQVSLEIPALEVEDEEDFEETKHLNQEANRKFNWEFSHQMKKVFGAQYEYENYMNSENEERIKN